MVFVVFDNFPNCFLNFLIFVTRGDIFWCYSTTFFNNVNIMFIETFCKLSFASYNFIFFNKFNMVGILTPLPFGFSYNSETVKPVTLAFSIQ